jgi:hypothetical protein
MNYKITVIDHQSILVVNQTGKLKRVLVPFIVYAHNEPSKSYWVEEVLTTEKDDIVYIINAKPYYHHHFVLDLIL